MGEKDVKVTDVKGKSMTTIVWRASLPWMKRARRTKGKALVATDVTDNYPHADLG